MWSSFLAIFRKEFIHVFRDRGTLIAAFSIPVFQLILFGFIDQTVKHLPTVVVDQDRSTASRELMDQMRASQTFLITRVTANPHEARNEIIAGRARVGVIIPPDFQAKQLRTSGSQILVLIDGSDSNASAQALASINGLIAQKNLEAIQKTMARQGQPVSAQPVIMFNPDGRTANFIIPGLIAILLQIVALVLAAVAIVREREKGTLEQLLVTPVNPLGLMLGKLAPYLIIGIAEMALVLFLMRFGFSVPIRGNLFLLFPIAVVYITSLLALGLFISTRAPTQAQAQQMAQMFLLPSIFLSGYIFPSEGLPFVLRWIGRFFPATHMIAILRGVILRDAGFVELLPNILALLAISAVLIWGSVRSFHLRSWRCSRLEVHAECRGQARALLRAVGGRGTEREALRLGFERLTSVAAGDEERDADQRRDARDHAERDGGGNRVCAVGVAAAVIDGTTEAGTSDDAERARGGCGDGRGPRPPRGAGGSRHGEGMRTRRGDPLSFATTGDIDSSV